MFKRRSKPTQRKIDLSRTNAQDIEYYCKTSVLDEILCKKLKRDFNKEVAEGQEKHVRFYLLIKKNSEYEILSGVLLEPWLKEKGIGELPETPKAKLCIDHYIQACYLQFK